MLGHALMLEVNSARLTPRLMRMLNPDRLRSDFASRIRRLARRQRSILTRDEDVEELIASQRCGSARVGLRCDCGGGR